jgi:hypothetical protein
MAASAKAGNGHGLRRSGRAKTVSGVEDLAVVVTVRVVFADVVPLLSVTDDGPKLHDDSAGKPVQEAAERAIVPLNPFAPANMRVVKPVPPG